MDSANPSAVALVAAAAFALILGGAPLAAQEIERLAPEAAPVERLGYGELPRLHTLPRDAYEVEPSVGVPYRSLFRNTRNPFLPALRSPDPGLEVRSDTAEVGFRIGLPDLTTRMSGMYAFNPEEADVKIGPVYFKLRALSAGILVSDNPTHDPNGSDTDAIAIMRLSMSVMAEITESLHFAAGGTLFWLPLEGDVGFGSDPFLGQLSFSDRDLFRAQLAWDTRVGEWDVFVADTFRVYPDYSNWQGVEDFVFFEGESFDASDRAGRYAFGAGEYADTRRRNRDHFDNIAVEGYTARNQIAGVAERLLPGPVRLRIRAFHEDLWYNQGGRGSPGLREGASLLLRSERENLRFNPFVRYDINRTDINPEFSQAIIGGIEGPITDQLQLTLYGGWYEAGGGNSSRALGGLLLEHVAGPYTRESLFVGREVRDYYLNEVVDSVRYRIRQVLGPRMELSGYVYYANATDLEFTSHEREEFGAGLRLSWRVGPRTTLQAIGGYRHHSSNNTGFLFGKSDDEDVDSEYTVKTLRLELGYEFTETFYGRLYYQYQDRDSTVVRDSYVENLVYLSLTKYFE